MNVSLDVVRDLVPAVLDGDASDASRRLVEEAAARHPEIAALLRESEGASRNLGLPEPPPAVPDAEVAALERTRRLVGIRSTLMGLAGFLTLCIGSVYFDGERAYWLVVERPELATLCGLIAGGLWIAYWSVGQRLRRAGV